MFPLGNLRGRLEAPEWNEATVLLRTDYPECDAATMPISIPAFPSQRRLPAALALAFLLGVTVCAGQPADRLGGEIVEERRVTLTGSRHPLAQAADFTGPMQPDQLLERAILVLTPDAEQETALEELTRAQQDPGSPDYRQWLTPQAFGERFGVSSGDLQKVMDWLTSHGLSVDEIPASRRAIVFSGTVRQVEAAFHTRMGRYTVSGSEHFANSTDLEIPAGLAAVVKGVVSLHDFRLPPAHSEVPTYTLANGVTLMMPRDWATIYDVTPLYGQGLDGTGQSLAVVGRTDLDLNDVRAFRTSAGLAANDPVKIFVNGVNPGMPNCVDEAESALDVEWAGALAKNATVKFVTAASGATDGVILAAQYAVANNVAPIVSVSYLHCELTLSDGGKSLWGALWSQAAAQGQSVFVASGDSGAAGCDLLSAKTATQGVAVNAICSSPNATCVGGTQFNDTLNRSQYWSASNGTGQSSALSYIPEQAWNETSWSGTILTATGGGVSTVYPRPAWQVGPGVPAGTMRLVPDLAASSAINDAYVIQIQGAPFYVAGTSASTPSIASVMALVLQSTGARLGNVNPALYTLATQQSSGGPAIFHDVTAGNNSVPGVTGYAAGTGYDMTTGLGSVDAFVLVNSWANSATSNFSLSAQAPASGITAGASVIAPVALTTQGGFASPVNLTAASACPAVSVSLSSPTITTAAAVNMTLHAAAGAATGACPVVVTGSGGGYKRTVEVPANVAPATFTLVLGLATASVAPGAPAQMALTTTASAGFSSAVALSVSGLPAQIGVLFSPASIAAPGSGTATVTLTASSGVAPGTYSATVTATGGGVTKTQPLSVTVPSPGFAISSPASGVTVTRGGAGVPVAIVSTPAAGFNSAVALSVSGLPAGVSAQFSPASIATPGSGSSTLTVSASSAAALASTPITVTATGGGVTRTLSLTVTIQAATFAFSGPAAVIVAMGGSLPMSFSVVAGAGFNSAVALSITGMPAGVTAQFSPASIGAPGTGSATLTVAASAAATPGSYPLTVGASGGTVGKSQTLTLTVPQPTFALATGATGVNVSPGGSTALVVYVSGGAGFNSAVSLAVSGLPANVTGTFSPNAIAAPGTGTATLTFAAAAAAVPGTYPLTITASSGGVSKTAAPSLTVLPPSFQFASNGTSVLGWPGTPAVSTLTVTGGPGFNAAVALTASGMAAGITGVFSRTSIPAPGSGAATLTLTPASTLAPGSYSFTVTATGGGTTRTLTLSLTVPAPTYNLNANTVSASAPAGGSASVTLSSTVAYGFNAPVTLSTSALPSGVTAKFAPASIAAPGGGTSQLTFQVAAGTKTGTTSVTVTATGGGISRGVAINLVY